MMERPRRSVRLISERRRQAAGDFKEIPIMEVTAKRVRSPSRSPSESQRSEKATITGRGETSSWMTANRSHTLSLRGSGRVTSREHIF